eukprot:7617902-Alexandrium_andersonii.AAC.1
MASTSNLSDTFERDLESVWLGDVMRQGAADGGLTMQQAPSAVGGNSGRDTTLEYGVHDSTMGYSPVAGRSSSG